MQTGRVRSTARTAFTLAEIAVTIAIVGLILVFVLQGINEAKLLAAQTRNRRLARELALQTLGQISCNLFKDEIRNDRIEGTYANEGHPEFAFEAVMGDQSFRQPINSANNGSWDNWRHDDEVKKKNETSTDEQTEQPYEKVQIKVTFPGASEDPEKNELVLEQWLPWKEVHPDDSKTTSSSGSKSSGASSSSPPASGG